MNFKSKLATASALVVTMAFGGVAKAEQDGCNADYIDVNAVAASVFNASPEDWQTEKLASFGSGVQGALLQKAAGFIVTETTQANKVLNSIQTALDKAEKAAARAAAKEEKARANAEAKGKPYTPRETNTDPKIDWDAEKASVHFSLSSVLDQVEAGTLSPDDAENAIAMPLATYQASVVAGLTALAVAEDTCLVKRAAPGPGQ